MLTQLFLLCAVVAISVVTANPLLQALVSQTCPICDRASLRNQIQNMLLQQANGKIQPYAQMLMGQNPSQAVFEPMPDKRYCNVCPQQMQNQNCPICNQQNMQNQNCHPPYQQQVVNQPYCPQPEPQNDPIIPKAINKLLSNPALKTILDPSTRLLNQNGFQVPRNGPCNVGPAGPPSVVNNYIIVPPEFLLEDTFDGSKGKKKSNEQRVNNGNNKRNQKPKRPHRENKNKPKPSNEEVTSRTSKLEQKDTTHKEEKRRRQKNIPPNIKVKVINENETTEVNQKTSSISNKTSESGTVSNINSEIFTTISPYTHKTEEFCDEKDVISKISKNLQKDIKITEIKNKTEPTTNQELEGKDFDETQHQKPDMLKEKDTLIPMTLANQNPKESATEKPKQRNKPHSNTSVKNIPTRNSREEAVIRDFRSKFPNIPEDVVRNLLDYMKRQLEKQNLGAPAFYSPQFPINYNQLYRTQFANISPAAPLCTQHPNQKPSQTKQNPPTNQNRNTGKRPERRRKNRRRRPKNRKNLEASTTTIEPDPTVIETTTVAPTTTTESLPIIESNTEAPTILVTPEVKEIETIETTTPKIATELNPDQDAHNKGVIERNLQQTYIQDSNEKEILSELGKEDVVPTIYINDLFDDYYPDFTGDHQYYCDEDWSIIKLEDDKYHYTTDKNYPLEELSRERRRDHDLENHFRRPGSRFIVKLKNRDRFRSHTRPNIRERRPYSKHKMSTTLRPALIDRNLDKPILKVTLQNENNADLKNDVILDDKESIKTTILEEEIQFRTPPTLERIDFETKPINKNYYFHDDLNYKTSSYSDAKTPHYEKNKSLGKPLDQIETVYARSKVVTYGQPVLEEISIEKDILTEDVKNKFEDDKTIIVAKSIYGDYW